MKLHKTFILVLLTFLLLSCSSQKSFKFAWLSDTHVSTAGGSGEEDLQNAVADINGLSDVKFTIISGDIAETDMNDNLKTAKNILSGLKKPYYIIPGNHDTKWTQSGGANFIKFWGSDKFVFDYKGYKFIGLHQGPVMRMADGHFAVEDLQWLQNLLLNLKNKKQPLIFVTHYPVDRSIDNWYQFLELVKNYNVKMILHGHGHRNRFTTFAGIPGIMGRSSLRRKEKAGGYNLVTMRGDSVFFCARITNTETKPAWLKLSLEKKYSPNEVKNSEVPDFSINDRYPNLHIKWVFNSKRTVVSAPVVTGNRIYSCDAGGTVTCLNLSDGKPVWRFFAGGAVFSTPAVADSHIVIASVDSSIYCLNRETGRPIWKVKTRDPVVASPVLFQGSAFIGSSDHIFRSIDLVTGKINWQTNGIDGFVETKPAISGNSIIFGAWDETLYALNSADGSVRWRWRGGKQGVLYSPAACWPVAANGHVFIVAPDRFMTAIDANTGKTVWRTNRYMVRETIGISADGSRIYARCMRDTVIAVSTQSHHFQTIWQTNCDFGYDIAPSMMTEKEGSLFFSTKNGLLYSLNGVTGKINWRYKFGNTLINTIAPVHKNQIVFSNMDGKVAFLIEEP